MSFFPSSSYLRKLITTSEERLEFLESEQLLPKNAARKDEIFKVKSELKTEIVKLKQDLKITEEPDHVKIKKIPAKNLLSGARYVPFNDWSQERLLLGSKTTTSRTKQYGNIGDTFQAGDKSFELTEVSRKNLWDIAQNYYLNEGAKSPEEFIEVWNKLHPKGFDPAQVVYFHKFRELTPETVHLKELLTKPSLTQEESRKAVSLAQTIYRTQSRNVLTARENIALNTQVRKNLGESYGQLIQEGEVKAAKVAAFRKRQLEEELNILGEIARKTEAPEIPALSPVTDTNFVKNTDAFPFITYEPRPAINYVVKPRQIDVSGFAPQWFSRFDKKEPTFFADWMENQEENLQMVLDKKTGIYSAMISRGKTTEFENKVVNFPKIIEGTLRKERTEKELAALAKKERSVEQKQILEDAKKLFIKVGGKLEEKDFWEYQVNDKGEVYQRLAFFRTPDGALVYAGDNEKIMLESRLSQAVPETGLEDVSFYDSEKIKKRIEERAKAYDKEQYDQDTILTNRGLPIKDADKLRRETDKFERDFVINFMINHPDQLKPWLDSADPKTIKYLNDVLGGEEVLRRKWLPQIEFRGKLYEVGRTKASYELPEGLPTETAELLKRDPEKYTLLDVGISPVKIEEIVKGPSPERTKNTVIYIVGHDIPKEPKDYEAFIQRLSTGKEPYFAKLGEEIAEEEAKKPEAGLGMSVSTDILDLLKGKGVPKGIQISSPLEIKNDIQVVRYVQPLKNMASFTPLQDAWKKGIEDITEQAKTVKGKNPDAAIGRIIKLNKAPLRFGAAQEGMLLTDEGKEIQFVAYKKDNPPLLEYNNRYSFKNPGETIEGSKTISRITQENVEKTNFPSQQITTRGIVYDVVDVNDPSGTAQYGHMISPADGKLVKFTTFSRDNPPVLKKNEAYTIYNAWLQGFQTNTGKIELNLNIKPENIYPERAAISKEQKALAEELRANTYRSEVHPTEYKPFRGQPPKPQKISPISDPVVATTVENGEIIVITSSGKRIPGKEYAKQYASLKQKKETGVAYDDETLNKIEDETPIDDDQLFMLGLLPIGAMGMTPEEFPGERTRKDLKQTVEDARAGLTNEELREQSQLAVQASMQHTAAEAYSLIDKPVQVIEKVGGELIDSALNLYRATPLKTIFTVKEAREYLQSLSPEEQKYAQQHPYETGLKFAGIQMLGDVGTILKPLSNTGYAVGGIASGEGPLEGIMKERIVSEELGIVDEDTSFWEWKKPERAVAGFLTDVVTDPASWVGVGVTKKLSMLKDLSMEKLWKSTVKEVPEFLTDDSAELGLIKREPVPVTDHASPNLDVINMPEADSHQLTSPIDEVPTVGINRQKQIADQEEVIERTHINWNKAGLTALAGATGAAAGYQMLSGKQQDNAKVQQIPFIAPNNTTAPITPFYAPTSQEQEESSEPTQPGQTAMEGVLGILDILNIPNYAVGSLISGKSFWDKTSISESLGITDKDTSLLSWRGAAGLAADIFLDPTTYLTLGSSAAVKIGAAGGKRIALSGRGVKALAQLKNTHGAQAESMLATAMLNDPKLYSKFHAVEGIGVRSWGPVIGGKFEYELVSKETLKGIAAAPGSINDDILRRMVTSGNIPLERAAVAVKGVEMSAAQKAARVRDVAGEALVPFYKIKKLARPASLAPGEPEYADKFLRFKKTVRLDVQKYVKVAEDLAKRSKAELGDDYNEILQKYLETPVLPREGLSQETQNILMTIEDYHKAFAIEEKQRGILEKDIPGYLRHALTKEAREYLSKGKKASTEVYDLKNFAGFAEGRTYKGSIDDINAKYRAAEGVDFDLFEPDVFAAFGIRASEHVKAVEEYDFLEWVARNYGKDVAAITDPGFTYTSLSQLNARLPPGTDTALLQDAKNILNQIDPLKAYTARSGAVFTAEDILKDVEAFNLISTKAAPLTRKEELAYTAIYLGKRMEDMTPRDAANYARTNLMRTQVPEEIAEHLEPEIFPKETSTWLKTYDKALTAWKFGQTVPWPAYHAQNIAGGLFNTMLLGEMRMRAAGESLSMLTGKSSVKMHKTAIGDEYTTEQVLKAAEELGVTGQPGLMDIPKEIKDVGEYIKYRTSDRTLDKIGRGWDKVSPTTVARTEEDWMRLSIFYDRLMKGDTPEDAASFVTKFLFEYMPEGKTGFERDYMRRMIPFYTYLRGNVPLQLESLVTQPGKYAAFAKANQAAMGNQTAPDWTGNWDLTAPAGEGYFYGLRTPASDLDKFSQYTDALSSPAQTEEDLYTKLKALEMFTPAVKGPAEVATEWNFFAQKPYEPGSFANYSYDPKTEAALSNIIGKPYSTAVGFEGVQQYNGIEGYKQKIEDFTVKQTTSVGRYKTQTSKNLEDQFNAALKRKNDFTWQQRFEGWKRDEMASPLSGIPDELQGGHIQAVAEGGLPIMENFLTMTKEENAEQTASQLFRLGLPEKEFKQEEFWEEMKVKEGTKLAESTLSTTEKLEKEGKWVNDAVREKLEYDAKKAINIQLYSRELAKIRMQLDWAQRRLRSEQASMDRKRKDPDFKGDKWSERQIQALEWFITKYQAQYTAIENLREQERVKEFELPDQIIQGEDYDKGMLGKEREVNIRGKGPALADPVQIKNMVKYDEIALERSVILEDVAVIDLPKYVPKQIRDSIKKPTGPEWKEKQDKAAWYARVIWGDESEVPNEPEPMEKSEEGWAVSPFMPMASVAMINIGTGRTSPVPGLNKPLRTPASPLEKPTAGESLGWNLRLPSVSDVVGLFLPHPAAAEPVSEEAVQQKSDMAKEAFLESDEFITAVQSIVTDYLDRGIER